MCSIERVVKLSDRKGAVMGHIITRGIAALAVAWLAFAAARSPTRPATRRTSQVNQGQEDYVYVWALGVEGLGDGSDKLSPWT